MWAHFIIRELLSARHFGARMAVRSVLVLDGFTIESVWHINLLAPKDDYSGRTAPLTSKCYILYIYSTNKGTEYFKHGEYCPYFPLQKA